MSNSSHNGTFTPRNQDFSQTQQALSTKIKNSVLAEEHQVMVDDQRSNDTQYFSKSRDASYNQQVFSSTDDNQWQWTDSLKTQKIEVLEMTANSLNNTRGSMPEPSALSRSKNSLLPKFARTPAQNQQQMKAFIDKVIQKKNITNPVKQQPYAYGQMKKHQGWHKIMKGVVKAQTPANQK